MAADGDPGEDLGGISPEIFAPLEALSRDAPPRSAGPAEATVVPTPLAMAAMRRHPAVSALREAVARVGGELVEDDPLGPSVVLEPVAIDGGRRHKVSARLRFGGEELVLGYNPALRDRPVAISRRTLRRVALVRPGAGPTARPRGGGLERGGAPLRVGFVVSRVGGEDGVSLEAMHWMRIYQRRGIEVEVVAGQVADSEELRGLRAAGLGVRELPLADPAPGSRERREEFAALFDPEARDLSVLGRSLFPRVATLRGQLRGWREERRLDAVHLENFTLPFTHLAMGLAACELIQELRLPSVSRGHDFPDDRESIYHWSQVAPEVRALVDTCTPRLPCASHVAINTRDRDRYYTARGFDPASVEVIPNTIDTSDPRLAPMSTLQRARIREVVLPPEHRGDFVVLCPVRPVARKRLDVALEFTRQLQASCAGLSVSMVVTHGITDAPAEVISALRGAAAKAGVHLCFADEAVAAHNTGAAVAERVEAWDLYRLGDLVAYFSDYEGYGNALLEVAALRLPTYINRYEVYERDLAPAGFDLPGIEIDPHFRFEDFMARGLHVFFEHPQAQEAARQLEPLVADAVALLAAKRALGVAPGEEMVEGPHRRRAEGNYRRLVENNSYEIVGERVERALWRALCATHR